MFDFSHEILAGEFRPPYAELRKLRLGPDAYALVARGIDGSAFEYAHDTIPFLTSDEADAIMESMARTGIMPLDDFRPVEA